MPPGLPRAAPSVQKDIPPTNSANAGYAPAPAGTRAAATASATADVEAEVDGLPKIKEGDKVHLPAFLNITTIQSWQTSLLQDVVATSGHRDISPVVKWLTKVWLKDVTFEELADSGSNAYVTLD